LIENNYEFGDLTLNINEKELDLLLEEFKDFNTSFSKVIKNLKSGYYEFEFYFYIEDDLNIHNGIMEVYTYDFLNKKCLNKHFGNFGYTNFASYILNKSFIYPFISCYLHFHLWCYVKLCLKLALNMMILNITILFCKLLISS